MDNAPLLTAGIAAELEERLSPLHSRHLHVIATGRVVCIDTQAGVFVKFMTEAEAREKARTWRRAADESSSDMAYLAALRDAGVIL